MTQFDLFGFDEPDDDDDDEEELPAFHSDGPDTERIAAESIAGDVASIRVQVLAWIKAQGGRGATGDEACQWWVKDHSTLVGQGSTVLSRLTELKATGYLQPLLVDGKLCRRLTIRNRPADVLIWTGKPGDGSEKPTKEQMAAVRAGRRRPLLSPAEATMLLGLVRAAIDDATEAGRPTLDALVQIHNKLETLL